MALDKFQPYLFVSAGEQSNKFLTPTYADGIAQFQAQRAQSLTGLTVRINAIQSGSGDPSPDNIRPISGRTGLTVTRAGKNLFDPNSTEKYWVSIGGSYSEAANAKSVTLSVASGMTFTLSSSNPWSSTNVLCLAFYDENDNNLSRTIQANGAYHATATAPNGSVKLIACCYTYADAGNVQLEIGSTQTAFDPYKASTTYPVTWESIAGTVYGGTLDAVSGVLTVTHGYILLDGSQDIRSNGRTTVTQRAIVYIVGKASGTTNIQSDRFAVTSVRDAVGKVNGRPASNGVEFYLPLDGTEDTNASCKQWFSNNNTQLVYELATPQTYRLTGAEVRTIAGYNQIYSDAGPVIDIKF